MAILSGFQVSFYIEISRECRPFTGHLNLYGFAVAPCRYKPTLLWKSVGWINSNVGVGQKRGCFFRSHQQHYFAPSMRCPYRSTCVQYQNLKTSFFANQTWSPYSKGRCHAFDWVPPTGTFDDNTWIYVHKTTETKGSLGSWQSTGRRNCHSLWLSKFSGKKRRHEDGQGKISNRKRGHLRRVLTLLIFNSSWKFWSNVSKRAKKECSRFHIFCRCSRCFGLKML